MVPAATPGRYDVSPQYQELEIGRIADQYEAIIRYLPAAPILVGHSLGGLVVQMDRGVGAAGIALCSFASKGMPLRFTALRWLLPPSKGGNGLRDLSRRRFDRDFAQHLTSAEQAVAWQNQIVPAPGRILAAQATGYWEVFERPDGSRQWAYQGYALYTNVLDSEPNRIAGTDLYEPLIGTDARDDLADGVAYNGAGKAAGLNWHLAKP